jgi:hypothetical protein
VGMSGPDGPRVRPAKMRRCAGAGMISAAAICCLSRATVAEGSQEERGNKTAPNLPAAIHLTRQL